MIGPKFTKIRLLNVIEERNNKEKKASPEPDFGRKSGLCVLEGNTIYIYYLKEIGNTLILVTDTKFRPFLSLCIPSSLLPSPLL